MPYTVNDKHFIIHDKEQNKIIKRKLNRVLQAESDFPNCFEQKITLIEEILKKEVNCENNVKN